MKDASDTKTIDFFGAEARERRAAIVRNTRSSAAEAKAIAMLQLGELITKIPPAIKAGGSINEVRRYQDVLKGAKKVAANSRSSINDLNSAINRMREFWSAAAQIGAKANA